jgi:hypothetical protein
VPRCPRKKIPTNRHRPSGQSVVTLSNQDHYLGPYGTAKARVAAGLPADEPCPLAGGPGTKPREAEREATETGGTEG